jgi:hypothetical protein
MLSIKHSSPYFASLHTGYVTTLFITPLRVPGKLVEALYKYRS